MLLGPWTQCNTLHFNNGTERQIQNSHTSPCLRLLFSRVKAASAVSSTYWLDIPKMGDVDFIHGHEIRVRFQVHIQFDDLGEVGASRFKDSRNVFECLSLVVQM